MTKDLEKIDYKHLRWFSLWFAQHLLFHARSNPFQPAQALSNLRQEACEWLGEYPYREAYLEGLERAGAASMRVFREERKNKPRLKSEQKAETIQQFDICGIANRLSEEILLQIGEIYYPNDKDRHEFYREAMLKDRTIWKTMRDGLMKTPSGDYAIKGSVKPLGSELTH